MLKTLFLLGALTASSNAAPADADADEAARRGRVGGVTVYDFEDDSVEGEVLSPEGANIGGRGRMKHASMIHIRPHFIPELVQLTLDL